MCEPGEPRGAGFWDTQMADVLELCMKVRSREGNLGVMAEKWEGKSAWDWAPCLWSIWAQSREPGQERRGEMIYWFSLDKKFLCGWTQRWEFSLSHSSGVGYGVGVGGGGGWYVGTSHASWNGKAGSEWNTNVNVRLVFLVLDVGSEVRCLRKPFPCSLLFACRIEGREGHWFKPVISFSSRSILD